jgi:hypothetical protein
MWQLVFGPGLSLLWGGTGHLILSDQVAVSIGWATAAPSSGKWECGMHRSVLWVYCA